jgi:hypothetical protein
MTYLLDARYSPELKRLIESLPLGTKLWWRDNDFTTVSGQGLCFITIKDGLSPVKQEELTK